MQANFSRRRKRLFFRTELSRVAIRGPRGSGAWQYAGHRVCASCPKWVVRPFLPAFKGNEMSSVRFPTIHYFRLTIEYGPNQAALLPIDGEAAGANPVKKSTDRGRGCTTCPS